MSANPTYSAPDQDDSNLTENTTEIRTINTFLEALSFQEGVVTSICVVYKRIGISSSNQPFLQGA